MAQIEVPVDFVILAYIIAVYLSQLWEIFRCFGEPTARRDTENMPRGSNYLEAIVKVSGKTRGSE